MSEREFRIGSVAKMTGIPTATLRTWERRHNVVAPRRSDNGERLYTSSEVTRLQLLRKATSRGGRIGELSEMADDELRAFIAQRTDKPPNPPPKSPEDSASSPIQIAVVAASLPEQLATSAQPSDIEICTIAHSLDALRERGSRVEADVLLVELDLLEPDPVAQLDGVMRLTGARGALVHFDFATVETIESVLASGARMIQTPVRLPILHQQIRDLANLTSSGEKRTSPPRLELLPKPVENSRVPRPRFRDDQLARLQEWTSDVECECPNHLASLVSGLLGFEQYSRNCESRNPEDASLHRQLTLGTAKARELVEEMLVQVCIQDGINY